MHNLRSIFGRIRRKLIPIDTLSRIVVELEQVKYSVQSLGRRLEVVQEALGRVEGRQLEGRSGGPLSDQEFRVYSQWGEDGIIQHLLRCVPIEREVFVEFGVETFEQANCRFLMINDNWSGLVIECDPDLAARIRRSREYWLYNLKVAEEMVTRENINRILEDHGVTGRIGLLSIDVDGMDYWIWEAIDAIEPSIVVIEYNHLFGASDAVTVPYRPDFNRRKAHHSIMYYGASLPALCLLAERKGYDFVGANRNGLNAFFVRKELRPDSLPALDPAEGFREGRFCEYHDEEGRRVKLDKEEQRHLVRRMPLVQLDADAATRSEGGLR